MSLPSYPSPAGFGDRGQQPGWYPLRPLGVGEILSAGLRIAVRHLAVLAPLAFLFTACAAAANLLVLAAKGVLRDYATGDLTQVPAGASTTQLNEFVQSYFGNVLPALAASSVFSLIATPVLAGVAAPFAALAATSRTGTNAAGLARLRSRWPLLLGVALAVALAEAVGLVLLVVPGIIVLVMLLPAGPVAAMEGLGVSATLRRATTLSKGFKWRLFGIFILIGLITGVIDLVLIAVLGQVVGGDDPVTRLILTQLLGAVVSAFVTPWSSAVTAMLYVDLRMRREGLAQTLLASVRPTY